MQQRSEEWFEARKGRITASMVGAILGHSPHMTREGVMRRMVRDACGAEPEFTGNIATEYGVANEPNAMFEYKMVTGHKIEEVGFIPFEDWAGCSPDGIGVDFAGNRFGVEIKCPFGLRNDEKPEFKSLWDQPHYYDQVQFSMAVTGFGEWNFFQWTKSGNKWELAYADFDWQAENMPKLRQFYAEYLDALKAPEAYLGPLRPVFDTPEAVRLVTEYDELGDAIENATNRRKEVLAQMVRLAGEVDAVVAGRNLTKVKRQGSVSYAKALAKYAPDADLEPFRGADSEYWRVG